MTYLLPKGNISSRFSSNSEEAASGLLQNLEEVFLYYYMNSDVYHQVQIIDNTQILFIIANINNVLS